MVTLVTLLLMSLIFFLGSHLARQVETYMTTTWEKDCTVRLCDDRSIWLECQNHV